MKYFIQVYEGEINGHVEKEGLPTEYQYEFEQEMLKQVHLLKNELREKGWKVNLPRSLNHHFSGEIWGWMCLLSLSKGIEHESDSEQSTMIIGGTLGHEEYLM